MALRSMGLTKSNTLGGKLSQLPQLNKRKSIYGDNCAVLETTRNTLFPKVDSMTSLSHMNNEQQNQAGQPAPESTSQTSKELTRLSNLPED